MRLILPARTGTAALCLTILTLAAADVSAAGTMDRKTGEESTSVIAQELKLDSGNVVLFDKSLKPGDVAPDFTLANDEGEMVSLAALLKQGPVVVVFYRGVW